MKTSELRTVTGASAPFSPVELAVSPAAQRALCVRSTTPGWFQSLLLGTQVKESRRGAEKRAAKWNSSGGRRWLATTCGVSLQHVHQRAQCPPSPANPTAPGGSHSAGGPPPTALHVCPGAGTPSPPRIQESPHPERDVMGDAAAAAASAHPLGNNEAGGKGRWAQGVRRR